MELLAKSINFNGVELPSDYAIVSFNAMDAKRSNVIAQSTLKGNITPYRDVPHFYGLNYTDVLKFDISIMKKTEKPLSLQERGELIAWFNGPANYCKLTVTDTKYTDYHKDIEYFVICTGYDEFSHHTQIYGYTFHFEANAPYGFSPEYSYTLIDNSVVINNPSLTGYYYPIIELTCNTRETIQVKILEVPSNILTLNVVPGQKLTIDNEAGDIKDNVDLFDYGTDSNLSWIYLLPGENTLSVTGDVTGYVKCRYPRKAGI